jgi:hypothetical protein
MTRSRLRRAIKLGLVRERIRYRSLQAVNLSGRVVEHLALLRDAEVRDHLKIGGVKLLNAAGQLADWQVAREHAAVWSEKLDGIEDPRSDLCDRPADAEDAFHPKDLNRDVVTGASGREGALPSLMAFVRQVDRPAHHRQHKLNVRIAGSHGRELGQLGPENFDLAAQVAATEQSEAILPNGVGHDFGR